MRHTSVIILLFIAIMVWAVPQGFCVTYYVSPTGNDSDDGFTPLSAWESIDNGCVTGVLVPGDTVNIMSGVYVISADVKLDIGGVDGQPIVYRGYGDSRPILDGGGDDPILLILSESYIWIERLELTNTTDRAVEITSDFCRITDCYIHDVGRDGVSVGSSDNILLRNIIAYANDDGIHNLAGNQRNLYYGNTIYWSGKNGFKLDEIDSRVFNNIVALNDKGIVGQSDNVCAYNDVWFNMKGDYNGGVSDSAGGISEDPLLINPAGGDFQLDSGSPCIDAGLDLGYPYNGIAPDMGAEESTPRGPRSYYVSTTGNDSYSGTSPDSAWATIDNGDKIGELIPGDTVNILSGTYVVADPVSLSVSGTDVLPIIYQAVESGNAIIDGSSTSGDGLFLVNCNNIIIDGLKAINFTGDGIQIAGDGNIVTSCFVRDVSADGIDVRGDNNLLLRNIVILCGESGFENSWNASNNNYYGNTVVDCATHGIYLALPANSSRVFNNIVVSCEIGINGLPGNICGFNDVWNNASGNYTGGISDSAGGISEDPLFVNATVENFNLQGNSPCIDVGLALGYSYNGTAPDMGALESNGGVNLPPIITPIGSQSVEEGQNLTFLVTALDPDSTIPSLTTEDIPVNATFVDNGDGTGIFDFNPGYTQAGSYTVRFIASDGLLADSELVEITVTPDPLSYIAISPDSVVVSADSTATFTVMGYDGGDNEIDPGNISWSLTSAIGTIDASGVFDAVTAGIGQVVATSDLGVIDSSAYLEVVAGALASLEVIPDRDTISADSTKHFFVTGFDSDGNTVSDVGTLNWNVLGDGIGSIDATGFFSAIRAGNGFIKATSDYGPSDITDTITVIPGSKVYVDVQPSSSVVIEDSSFQFHIFSYDSDSNLVTEETSSATWSTTDPSGSITSGGLYTAGNNPSPPTYYVEAEVGSLRDSSEITVITSGSISYIRIESIDSKAQQVNESYPDTTFTTDDDGILFYCRAYDSGDNLIGDISVEWSLIGPDSIGYISPGPSTSAELTLTTPGNSRVLAALTNELTDTTGVITCISGAPAYCIISPDTATITSDSSLQFSCLSYDADGNQTGQAAVLQWSVLGNIGTISSSGLLTPTQAGVGYVVCTGSGVTDTTNAITVTAGDLNSIEISPDSVQVVERGNVIFTVTGYDADMNPTDVGVLNWSVIGDIGEIDNSGEFTATTPGVGKIAVVNNVDGIADTNTAVVVQPASLSLLVVSPDTASLMVSGTKSFTANGFDELYQPAYVGDLKWEVLGGIGTIDSLGNFTASARGVGQIVATSSIDSISDTTQLILVEVPSVSEVPIGNIYSRPGKDLSPLLAFSISNAFDTPNQLESITARLAFHGEGTNSQLLSNVDSVHLYLDANGDGILERSDTELAGQEVRSNVITFSIQPLTLGPGSESTFFVSMRTSMYPHDSDSVDAFLNPSTDIYLANGIDVAGPDTLNSLGYCIIDGLIADQLVLTSIGSQTTTPAENLVHVMTIDIPRNGYAQDILQILSLENHGNAGVADIDSLVLFRDNGDNVWSGAQSEIAIGGMKFTGGLWTISGITVPLQNQFEQFHIAARLTSLPANGASMAFGIPVKAIEVVSDNDGPVDSQIDPVDTIVILSSEILSAKVIELQAHELVPGVESGPMLAVEITNTLSEAVTISSLKLQLVANDPDGATQDELDSQIESVSLWLNNDGDFSEIGATDVELASTNVSDGYAVFDLGGISIDPGGGSVGLFIQADLDNDNTKNGNSIGFAIAEASDIVIPEGYSVSGSFPLANSQVFTVNAFPSSSITVHAIDGATLYGGQTDQPVLDVEIPGDGYDDAVLKSFRMGNASSSDVTHTITNVKLWMDNDGNGYDDGDDFIAQLEVSGGYWQNEDISRAIPATGARIVVTVSVGTSTVQGGTLLPQIPEGGIEFGSGTTGPDDRAVENPESFMILPSDQVTVVSVPINSAYLYPGTRENTLLMFALYNGYPDKIHSFEALRLSDYSSTVSTMSFADSEIGQLSLYYDADSNRVLDGDPIIASGYFSDGQIILSGLGVNLKPQSISHFFVVADIPLLTIDSDTLIVGVESSADFVFDETVNINGDLPLMPGGATVIDGSVAAQYKLLQTSEQSVSPGQQSVVLLSFIPAVNGDQVDNLSTITLQNLGSAPDESVSALALWIDSNGDSTWQITDSLVGYFINSDNSWAVNELDIEMRNPAPVLFAVGDISHNAEAGTTLRFAVPVEGCQYSSGNDGPIDVALESSRIATISDAGLSLTYEQLNPTYSIGQQIGIDITVTNRFAADVDSVYCRVVSVDNPDLVNLTDSILGPISIESGGESNFFLQYEAMSIGTVTWQLQAYSATSADSSVVVSTETVSIQQMPSHASIDFVSSIPTSVTRGQSHVFPLSLICSHIEYDSDPAPLRLDSLVLSIEDANGLPVSADSVFSRIVLSAGYTVLSILEELTNESSVVLHFSEPFIVLPGDFGQMSLRTDIDSVAVSDEFKIVIESDNAIPFVDANSGLPVPVDPSVEFPLQTAVCRIDNPSHCLLAGSLSQLPEEVNYGQEGVTLLDLIFTHPGEQGSSQIQLNSVEMVVFDEYGNPVAAGDLFSNIVLKRRQSILGMVSDFSQDDKFTLLLNSPPVFSPGETETLTVVASLSSSTSTNTFKVVIPDSASFEVRDLSSGSVIPVVGDVDSMLAGNAFPMSSGLAQLVQAAAAPEVCIRFTLPQSVVAGSDSIALINMDADYNTTLGHSSITLREMRIMILDTLGGALDPYRIFDRIGYRSQSGSINYQQFFELRNGYVVFEIDDADGSLAPGEETSFDLVADLKSDIPYDYFMLLIPQSDGIVIEDANDSQVSPGFTAPEQCEYELPLASPVSSVFVRAGRPSIAADGNGVLIGYRGQQSLSVPLATVSYNSTFREGDLELVSIRAELVERTTDGLSSVQASVVLDKAQLVIGGTVVAEDSIFENSFVLLDLDNGYEISSGDESDISLVCSIRGDAALGNYLFVISDSTALSFRDQNLLTSAYPDLTEGAYPLYSSELSISEQGLSQSFSNYPNPFNPSNGEETNIVFVLPEAATVDIEIFSITGEIVKILAIDATRQAGENDSDKWFGRNDNGFNVAPGTYFCRITAKYDSGIVEHALRKIAVIR